MRRRRGGLNFNRHRKKFNFKKLWEVLSWIGSIAIIVVLAYITVAFFGRQTKVVGQAMSPTLVSGETVWVNKLSYVLGKPRQGDLVVFLPNGNEKSHYYIRRVVACPGDTVMIKDGAVYVNGSIYKEKVETPAIEDPGLAAEEITLASDEYFLLGDNRNDSEDSRFANIGNVKRDYLVGKPWFHFRSIRKFGFVK